MKHSSLVAQGVRGAMAKRNGAEVRPSVLTGTDPNPERWKTHRSAFDSRPANKGSIEGGDGLEAHAVKPCQLVGGQSRTPSDLNSPTYDRRPRTIPRTARKRHGGQQVKAWLDAEIEKAEAAKKPRLRMLK